MFGGSSQSQHATNAFSMPQSQIAGTPLGNMMPFITAGIQQLMSGSAANPAIAAATKASNMNLATGLQQEKSAFAGTGMATSSALMSGMNQMTQQAGINLASITSNLAFQGLQSGIGDILNMAAGTGNQWGSQFGWNAGLSLSSTYGTNPAGQPYGSTTVA
jgi:hypothetical protein